MQPKDKTKLVTFDGEAHQEIAKGVEIMAKAVGSTYGPGGRNVLIKKKYVQPILTRDGVTVARDIAGHGNRLSSPIATEAAKLVYQASEKTNKTAGDGTTGTVVLLSEVYKGGRARIVAGEDAMVIKRQLDKDRDAIVRYIESKSSKADKKKLNQVGVISAGDEALGHLISDLIWEVGSDGAVTIEYQNAPNVEVEKVTGYLFGQGFRFLTATVQYEQPLVFVTQKRLASKTDIIPFLNLVSQAQKQFVIVGDVSGAALETLVWALQNQKAEGLVVPPPAYGADGHDYFEDIATYCGARLWLESDSFNDVTLDDLGVIKRSQISNAKAVLFGDNETTGDAVAERIATINEQLKGEMTTGLQSKLEQRKAKLAGKVSIIKVGAATEVEREELFFRVEDAVEACKSAMSSGIVAGGATTLLFASREAGKDGDIGGNFDAGGMHNFERASTLEPFVRDALQQPFRLLMANAAEDGGYRINQVLNAGYGKGFNLRNMTEEPVDLLENGIVDATKVIVQTVQNAFSVAGALLTTGTTITEVEDDEESSSQN